MRIKSIEFAKHPRGVSLVESLMLIALVSLIALPAVTQVGKVNKCTLQKATFAQHMHPVCDTPGCDSCVYFDGKNGLETLCPGPPGTNAVDLLLGMSCSDELLQNLMDTYAF